MTYLEILNLLMNTARRSPNINTVVREFTDLNREGIEYSAIVIQDRDGYRDYVNNQDYITYTWYIGYVDMLTEEAVNNESYPVPKTIDNRDDIVSTGINVINDIINTINSSYYPHLELTVSDRINTFHQRFTAECAGVYMVLNANVPLSDCSESEVELFSKISERITENGVYHYVPSGEEVAYDGVDITVDVSSEKPEELLQETINTNGRYNFSPSAGSVFSEADITVDVPEPKEEQSLYEEITWNGDFEYHPDPGKVFGDVEVIVSVHPSTSLSASYTSNGSYSISGEFDGGVVTVAVPSDQKPEQVGSFEVTEWNTTYTFVPDQGYVFSEVDVFNNTPVKTYVSTVTSNSRLIWNASEGEALVSSIDISVAVPTTVTVTMTQAQYDDLQVKDPNTIYLING